MNAPFIQQAMLSTSRNAAGPNDSFDAALRAEDIKEKEQRGEEEEAHELFHALHPRAGLRQKPQPGRLRAEQQIGQRSFPRRWRRT